jgi:branched-chain amino acid transport system permease protein
MIDYLANLVVLTSLYWILAASLDLALGYCGIFSIAQAGFYGIGAYSSALLSIHLHLPFPLNLLTSAIIGGIIALMSASILLRLQQDYLALATLGFGVILQETLHNWESVTGGSRGLSSLFPAIPPIQIFGYPVTTPTSYALLTSLSAGLVILILYKLERSSFGVFLRGINSDETALQSLGTNTLRLKATAFTIAAIGAAIAGSLYAHYLTALNPSRFSINESFVIITAIVLGGRMSTLGILSGATALIIVPEILQIIDLPAVKKAALREALFAVILITILIFRPQGLFPRKRPTKEISPDSENLSTYQPLSDDSIPSETLLYINYLSCPINREFTLNVSQLRLETGKIYGLVGANGSGKSTFLNALTGLIPVARAKLIFAGHQITKFHPDKIARLGIARTFQSVRLHADLTILENLSLAKPVSLSRLLIQGLWRPIGNSNLDLTVTKSLLSQLHLTEYQNYIPQELSFGQQKAIEIVRAISRQPRLLLMDEPASGLSDVAQSTIISQLLFLKNKGTTILIVEHDQDFLNQLCDHFIYIDNGSITSKSYDIQ